MSSNLLLKTGLVAMVAGMVACNNANNQTSQENQADMKDTTAAAAGTAATETSIFDGKSLAGWHGYNKKGEVKNWIIEDGALVCLGAAKGDTGGDIVSDNEYENFELSWEWKINKGGNSGVMYHVVEDPKYKGPYETGPEYQMIDDEGYPDKLEDWQKTGADYAMNLPNDKKKVKPIGEWNTSRIVYNNGHVEHWLNGEKIVEFQAGDDKWNKEKSIGKWKDFPDYGSAKKGRIALQDHGNKAYFKNIMIKIL
ncbi:3-keto-disaccharide hydrolase, partial [Flavihumibacter solisilvae]|uniref:3-keto-disaccharide hydrolase n=1 Tax=Flavihumibacter solisilvae TaxID=1349421 RepID=UPI00057E5D4A